MGSQRDMASGEFTSIADGELTSMAYGELTSKSKALLSPLCYAIRLFVFYLFFYVHGSGLFIPGAPQDPELLQQKEQKPPRKHITNI